MKKVCGGEREVRKYFIAGGKYVQIEPVQMVLLLCDGEVVLRYLSEVECLYRISYSMLKSCFDVTGFDVTLSN